MPCVQTSANAEVTIINNCLQYSIHEKKTNHFTHINVYDACASYLDPIDGGSDNRINLLPLGKLGDRIPAILLPYKFWIA
jgi:hypothetical protein